MTITSSPPTLESRDFDEEFERDPIPSARPPPRVSSLLGQSRPSIEIPPTIFLCNDTLVSLYALACKAQVNFAAETPLALEAWQVSIEGQPNPHRYFLVKARPKGASTRLRFSCVGRTAIETLGMRPLGREDLRVDQINQFGLDADLDDHEANDHSSFYVRAWGRGVNLGGFKAAKERFEGTETLELDSTPPIGPHIISSSPSPGFLMTT